MANTPHNRTGRRPLPAGKLRSRFFRFRVSAEERRQLDAAAHVLGRPLGELIREAALKDAQRICEVSRRLQRVTTHRQSVIQ